MEDDSYGGHVAQTDGGDIMFTAGDGITKLDHEIEKYDPATGELVAWVEVRSLSGSTNTNIYIYYGNATVADQWNLEGVWDGNYAGVWHLKEVGTTAADAFKDSTSNANHGQGGGGTPGYVPVRTTSHLGYGQTFDGTDDIIAIGDPVDGSLDMGAGSFSYSVWVNVTSSGGTWDMPWWKGGSSAGTTGYDMELGTGSWEALISDGSTNPNVAFGNETDFLNQWVLLTAVVDRSTNVFRIYADGSYKGETGIAGFGSVSNSGSATIGNDQNNSLNNRFKGIIDEVRVAKFAYNASWIETEYNNQRAPAAFYTVGIEETSGTGADPFQNGWTYRKRITIDSAQIPSDQTNFPVLIKTTDLDLTKAQANFDDILFTAADGTTKLDHEIEDYDQVTGKLVAWVEVRSPFQAPTTPISTCITAMPMP